MTYRDILGVQGDATSVEHNSKRITKQTWVSATRRWKDGDDTVALRVKVRFDDSCNNGHPTFAITGDGFTNGRHDWGGCCHDEIAEHFPELTPLIKWHLTSSDGPMHYPGNPVYRAGNRDYNGSLKGVPNAWAYALTFGDNPILHKLKYKFIAWLQQMDNYDFEVIQHDHVNTSGTAYKFGPKFTLGAFGDKWHECPFDSDLDAKAFLYALQHCQPTFTQYATRYGEGKDRELDHARSAAVWPEATDEELSVSKADLTAALKARHPALVAAFLADMKAIGFVCAVPE
ncbi:hypothetical protein SAMN05216227_102025 [Pseudorhodobacter antarcticus]|uniref:Uncharacterized protein n=1 Tax=Pseudorhodobacter antarcticus TaxID=1077947 RepID=A0A1H8IG43_9RHOB|nr:hypothetical protein [Pseudorhodobacter antarcticus]SEN67242.1 hypothetical protein SAMN05216227_102025 [Pseudorhodobacter antarcticus]